MLRQFFSKQNLVQEVDASGSMEQERKGSKKRCELSEQVELL